MASTDKFEHISGFSSKGPPVDPAAPFGPQKPEIAAPGSNVRSATHLSDDSYSSYSGTSMATPHVAGAMALLLSLRLSDEQRTLAGLTKLLTESADVNTLVDTGLECGGVPGGVFPDFAFGAGRLNACKVRA